MRIAVLASKEEWDELMRVQPEAECVHLEQLPAETGAYDAWIITRLRAGALPFTEKPVFVHAVAGTAASNQLPPHAIRINAWKGFLGRTCWELAGPVTQDAEAVVRALGRIPLAVADEPGLVAGRVLAMIINEAYYALGEGVSTRAEIDTAMKLGTNYPFGPFEWAEQIGVQEIYCLLVSLQSQGNRYRPAPRLAEEALT